MDLTDERLLIDAIALPNNQYVVQVGIDAAIRLGRYPHAIALLNILDRDDSFTKAMFEKVRRDCGDSYELFCEMAERLGIGDRAIPREPIQDTESVPVDIFPDVVEFEFISGAIEEEKQ